MQIATADPMIDASQCLVAEGPSRNFARDKGKERVFRRVRECENVSAVTEAPPMLVRHPCVKRCLSLRAVGPTVLSAEP